MRMGTLMARNWWTIALRGLIAVLFGIAVFAWPGISLVVLVNLFGLFALIGGFLFFIAGIKQRRTDEPWWLLLIEGILSIALGIMVFIWPGISGLFLVYFIAAWAIMSGIFELVSAIQLRRQIYNEWLLAAAGIVSLLFGLFIVIWPVAGALAILWVIGAYALIFGVIMLTLAFRLRTWHRREPPRLIQ